MSTRPTDRQGSRGGSDDHHHHRQRHPPGAWPRARIAARRLLAPVDRFVDRFVAVEASSGILLVVAAAVAFAWANSPLAGSYRSLWHTPIGIRIGGLSIERDLHFLVNDGLMTVFFFVVGLEIRREIYRGELSELGRAALPLVAALGGMLAPAAIYLVLNRGGGGARGWGVPMATDIAFAVGVLALLGKRVPPALRILLLALAVIDDVGAILVIAIFYSGGLGVAGLAVAAGAILAVLLLQKLGVRSSWAYAPAGVVLWAGVYAAGVHPTVAGVALGLLTPARTWLGRQHFVGRANATLDALEGDAIGEDKALLSQLDDLKSAGREAVSPAERLEHALHGWVAFAIMPLFALANAGVSVGQASVNGEGLAVFLGVALGLMLGKPAGILAFCWLAARARLVKLPDGVRWSGILVAGAVAGIGFTMALFIATLAFPDASRLDTAKLAILCASAGAAILGVTLGRFVLSGSGG
jgi:NhaA family Na+:H+ antiporter